MKLAEGMWPQTRMWSSGCYVGKGHIPKNFLHRNYFIVMVPLRKSRGGQFPILMGSPEDMDLEEVRPALHSPRPAHNQAVVHVDPGSTEAPRHCLRSSSRTSPGCRGAACATHASWKCPGLTLPPVSPSCQPSSIQGTRSNMAVLTTAAWNQATATSSLCLRCCRRTSL